MSAPPIRRIAICTGGGDAPGLNAVIRAVVLASGRRGWECYGIRDGFNGILFPERYVDGGVVRLTRDKVRDLTAPSWLCDSASLRAETGWRPLHTFESRVPAIVAASARTASDT